MLNLGIMGRRFSRSCATMAVCAGLAGVVFINGCQDHRQGSESQFVVHTSDSNQRIMKRFYDNLAQLSEIDVCIGFVGIDRNSDQVQSKTEITLRSLGRWFSALKTLESWKGKSTPKLVPRVQFEACRYEFLREGDRFGITFFASQRHFSEEICGARSAVTRDSSGAIIGVLPPALETRICQQNLGASLGYNGQGAVYISPLANTLTEEHVMHELGHVMGLGDTYHISGSAPSLMNLKSGVEPSPDDMAGIEQVLRFSQGEDVQCPGGQLQGLSNLGDPSAVYCDFKKDWESKRLAHIELEKAITTEAPSQSRVSPEPAQQASSTVSKENSNRAILIFKRDSYFKASPFKQAVELSDDEVCAVQAGQKFMVYLEPSKDDKGHSYYRVDSPIEGCPAAVAKQGYFFTDHATIRDHR